MADPELDRIGGLFWQAFADRIIKDIDEFSRTRQALGPLRAHWDREPDISVSGPPGKAMGCFISLVPARPFVHGWYVGVGQPGITLFLRQDPERLVGYQVQEERRGTSLKDVQISGPNETARFFLRPFLEALSA